MTDIEAQQVWERAFEADVRSVYFAELAAIYSNRKRLTTAASLLFSSSAFVAFTSIPYLGAGLTLIAACCTAYSLATDRRGITAVKLHAQWNSIGRDLWKLWGRWFDDDADQVLQEILKRSGELSETAAIDSVHDKSLMAKAHQHVCATHAP